MSLCRLYAVNALSHISDFAHLKCLADKLPMSKILFEDR